MSGHAIRARLAQEDGVTLIETLVVVAILLVVITGMTTLFVSASSSQVDQSNRVEAQQDARVALDALRREIHCATSVPTSSPSSISFVLPSVCPSAVTTTSAPFTLPAAGTFTVTVGSTSKFNSGANAIYLEGSPVVVSCTGTSATTFTGCSGGTPGAYLAGNTTSGTTWCTAVSGALFTLWRYVGGSCSGSTGRRVATRLVTNQVFTYGTVAVNTPSVTSTGGALVADTYFYVVTAVDSAGKESSGGIASTAVTGNTNQITLSWAAYTGAVSYNVYGRDDVATTTKGLKKLANTTLTSYTDNGSINTATLTEPPPLRKIGVALVVDVDPATAKQRFTLNDDIVLRNSGRG